MKVKVLKKSFTIQGESKAEVQAMLNALDLYDSMVYQDANPDDDEEDSHYDSDDMMRQILKKFEKVLR